MPICYSCFNNFYLVDEDLLMMDIIYEGETFFNRKLFIILGFIVSFGMEEEYLYYYRIINIDYSII